MNHFLTSDILFKMIKENDLKKKMENENRFPFIVIGTIMRTFIININII